MQWNNKLKGLGKNFVSTVLIGNLMFSNVLARQEIGRHEIEEDIKEKVKLVYNQLYYSGIEEIETGNIISDEEIDREWINILRRMLPVYTAIHFRQDFEENKEYIKLYHYQAYGTLSNMDVTKVKLIATGLATMAKSLYPDSKRDQALWANNWLCNNVEYDINILGKEGNDAYGALVLNRAVCEGYAKAYSLILDRLGIPNIVCILILPGGEGHAWNLVYMGKDNVETENSEEDNGEWLVVDVTNNKYTNNKYFLTQDIDEPYNSTWDRKYYEELGNLRRDIVWGGRCR